MSLQITNQDLDFESTIFDIRSRLSTDVASWELALEEYKALWKRLKPWSSREWIKKRETFLGHECVQCGSHTPPFVVQHLWHPMKFDLIFKMLSDHEWTQFKQNYVENLAAPLREERKTCPYCGSMSLYFVDSLQLWTCIKCKKRAKDPVIKKVLTRDGGHKLRILKQENFRKNCELFKKKQWAKNGKMALLILLEQTIHYINLEGATTFCKKCAFLWDKKGLRLCQKCGSKWHMLIFPCCIPCASKK